MTSILVPELCLVLLVGPSGAGKTTFARRHFQPTEILSFDFCRALITDNEKDPSVMAEATDLLHSIAAKRLAAGRLTVIDAANLQPEARKPLLELAREYYTAALAIVFDLPEDIYQARNRARVGWQMPSGALHRQVVQMRQSLRGLQKEGLHSIFTFTSPEQVEDAAITRQPTPLNHKQEHGPFDIIGDLHGCCDELEALLEKLGYTYTNEIGDSLDQRLYFHPAGRRVIFLGDLVDRGPRILDTLLLVRNMVLAGHALMVPGNHDDKLLRKLNGRNVHVSHAMQLTLDELNHVSPGTRQQTLLHDLSAFLGGLVSHYVLDDGKLVVAHAGLKAHMQGRDAVAVRQFALYGETNGEADEFGLPVRLNWAAEYHGSAKVVYGHTPVVQPEWQNQTINIDTGCAFGGKLTALRYPELELVSVPAARVYSAPVRPLASTPDSEQAEE